MTVQSVRQIIEQMRSALKEDNSDLHTFPTYGNLYSIYRSVALVIQEQDIKLNTINSNLLLSTATGESLDNKASDFNIFRIKGQPSSGPIIVQGSISSIDENTILTDPSTGLQFQLQNRVRLINNRGSGSVISTDNTAFANLRAGTELFNSIYPNIRFVVGGSFDPISNNYLGNLNGGRGDETDEELRARVLTTVSNINNSNTNLFEQQVLNIDGISKLDIIENFPGLGYITVYINNSNQQIINEATILLENVKPIGTAIVVEPFKNVEIDITITITTFSRQPLPNLENNIKQELDDYIQNISTNNELTVEGIAGVVYNVDGISNVKVITPTSSISIKKEETLNLGTLTINYK